MMKIGFANKLQAWAAMTMAVTLVLTLTSCQNQKKASASVGGTGAAAYPDSVPQAAPLAAVPEPAPAEKIAPAPQFKPFSLKEGEELVSYKAAPGDTLGKIATRFNTSVSRIKSANGLSSDNIYAGKSYKIPTRQGSATQAPDEAAGYVSQPPGPPKPEPASSRYGGLDEENADRLSPPAYNPPTLSTNNTYIPPAPQDTSTTTREYGPPPVTVPTSGGGSAFPQPSFGPGSF